jgi:hypothetical protein
LSLNKTEITALCERFRAQAKTFRSEAEASARSGGYHPIDRDGVNPVWQQLHRVRCRWYI